MSMVIPQTCGFVLFCAVHQGVLDCSAACISAKYSSTIKATCLGCKILTSHVATKNFSYDCTCRRLQLHTSYPENCNCNSWIPGSRGELNRPCPYTAVLLPAQHRAPLPSQAAFLFLPGEAGRQGQKHALRWSTCWPDVQQPEHPRSGSKKAPKANSCHVAVIKGLETSFFAVILILTEFYLHLKPVIMELELWSVVRQHFLITSVCVQATEYISNDKQTDLLFHASQMESFTLGL